MDDRRIYSVGRSFGKYNFSNKILSMWGHEILRWKGS
jgi:hypothetical protein